MGALGSSLGSSASLGLPRSPADRPPASAAPASPTRWARPALQVASLAACVLLWQWAASQRVNFGLVTFANVPPPGEVLQAAWALLQSPKLGPHLLSSLMRVGLGFGAAV